MSLMLTLNMLYKLYTHTKCVTFNSYCTYHINGSFVDPHRYQCSESLRANHLGHSLKVEAPGE